MEKETKRTFRNLDGVYFRLKMEDGKYRNVCFSDMTRSEREQVMNTKNNEWIRSLCQILADTIREIGDELNIEKH